MLNSELLTLPIAAVLDELKGGLRHSHELVLQAPPGAGKTTVVPLALLDEAWLGGLKILVLEPRRMAATAAASRMAQLLGESVGETVGYRIRLDSCVSHQTRIEVITEGILTRRLQSDPGLEDVGLIIFDEFHERNLDSDLCLALALQGRETFREGGPLKLLLMSATLDGEAAAKLLGGAPIVSSQGREYPIETHYSGAYRVQDSPVAGVVRAVNHALANHAESILVFLPGQREINAVSRELASKLREQGLHDVLLAPLYGGLSMARQQEAIAPPLEGKRKVVLATNVAETSLTIEGVTVVIDSGLARQALFDPNTGMTRLTTRRISKASARQRQGRAGRLGPGHCYRLWSEEQQERLVSHSEPEILQADLAPLVLQLLAWGVASADELQWLDSPPQPAYQQALAILEQCGAVFCNHHGVYQLTPHGVRIAQMPLHPRLGHMLLVGCDIHATETACLVAAMFSERNPLAQRGADVSDSIMVLMGETRCEPQHQGWFRRIWQQTRRYARIAAEVHAPRPFAIPVAQEDVLGILLASAYPDRIAQRRPGQVGTFLLSNGRSATLPESDLLAQHEWIACADLGGRTDDPRDKIYSAASLSSQCFDDILSSLVRPEEQVEWDYRNDQFVARRNTRVGKILLSSEVITRVNKDARSQAIIGMLRKRGLDLLPWDKPLLQWRARVQLLHDTGTENAKNVWPDLSDEALLATLDQWLLAYLSDVAKLQDFQRLDLKKILLTMLPWPLPLDLERLAPERLGVPSGSSIAIDYGQRPPVLAVKLQEMFGCEESPTVAGGRVPLQVHLLSPAGRPLQVTQDLAGFWRTSYHEVRKEMKGRYPKHPWPEDPLVASATRHTKKRVAQQ